MADDIKQALLNAGLLEFFEKLPLSHRREYLAWLDSAKKPETRANRIAKMLEMLK